MLSKYVLYGWPSTEVEVQKEVWPYWFFGDEVSIIDRIAMKGILMTTATSLQKKGLDQLHLNHMGIEETRLLAYESIYCPVCLDFQPA